MEEKTFEELVNKNEFLRLYNKWYHSYIFSAFGPNDPNAREHYLKLREWCANNKGDALLYIRELLLEEPSDIVLILDDLYKNEFGFNVDGYCPLDTYCNLWLNVTNAEFDNKHIIDYYEDYNKWHDYLKDNYIPWNPFKEQDPNVTLEEFKQGKRNDKKLLKERKK